MKKLRIVLIRSNPVRPYPRLEKMANSLLKAGYGIQILAWDREENYAAKNEYLTLVDGIVPITRIGIKGVFSAGIKKNLFPLIKFQLFIFSWLKKHKKEYDVIHAYDFDTGFMASICAKIFNKIFVYDIPDYYVDSHGLKNSKIGNWIKKNEDKIIDYADATIICTEKRLEQIEGTHPNKIIVVHNTPYDRQLSTIENLKFEFDKEKLKIAYIGIFGRARFIDKITEVVESRDDCEFHIAGFGGNMEEYFEEAAKRCENIKYYGRVPYNETLNIEKNCDVLCAIYDPKVPNHRYAAPNKFYEALMLGKPLIMARNTGMDSIIEEKDIGVVIDYNKESLDKALDILLSRRVEWEEMGKRARILYDTEYSWSVMERRIEELYKELGRR